MHPFITVKKNHKFLDEFFLDSDRPKITIGSSHLCDFTAIDQVTVNRLTLFAYSRNRLTINLAIGMDCHIMLNHEEHDLQTLIRRGIAKQDKWKITIKLRPLAESTGKVQLGDLTFLFAFQKKPVTVAPIIRLPLTIYLKQSIRDWDWTFITIIFLMVILSLQSGKYLYGLPLPQPTAQKADAVQFTFTRIVVPAVTAVKPTVFEERSIGKASSKATVDKVQQRESSQKQRNQLLETRIGSLLDRIDSSLKLPTSERHLGKRQDRTNTTKERIDDIDQSGLNSQLKLRRLYNIEQKNSVLEKRIANIQTDNNSDVPIKKSARLDRSSANRVIRKAQGQLRPCYEQALKTDRDLRGRIYISLRVRQDGLISDVKLKADRTIRSPGLLLCLRRVVEKLNFPPAQTGSVPIRFSVDFTPSQRRSSYN